MLSVAGYTVKGRGNIKNTSVFFTRQGSMFHFVSHFIMIVVPRYGPQITTAMWVNVSSIKVNWIPLTLLEARGFVQQYTVTAQPHTISTNKRQVETLMINTLPNETTVYITNGLDPKVDYVIVVSANTEAGISTNNYNTTLPAIGMYYIIHYLNIYFLYPKPPTVTPQIGMYYNYSAL